jgi:hypothetical protein
MIDVGGYSLHAVHVPRPDGADLPPLVFIHGASGNLRDQMVPFRPMLEAAPKCCSSTGPVMAGPNAAVTPNQTPDGQAAAIARAMQAKGISQGHNHRPLLRRRHRGELRARPPGDDQGLVFLAPATHPWPGGISWYYDLTRIPVIGPLFAYTLAAGRIDPA